MFKKKYNPENGENQILKKIKELSRKAEKQNFTSYRASGSNNNWKEFNFRRARALKIWSRTARGEQEQGRSEKQCSRKGDRPRDFRELLKSAK